MGRGERKRRGGGGEKWAEVGFRREGEVRPGRGGEKEKERKRERENVFF